MFLHKYKAVLLSLVLVWSFAVVGTAQKNKEGQGSVSQRLDVMRQKLETMRGKSVEIRSLALEAEYVHQLQAFGPALDYAHRVSLACHRPVAHVVGRPVVGIDANGIIQVGGGRSGFGKGVVGDFHKRKI